MPLLSFEEELYYRRLIKKHLEEFDDNMTMADAEECYDDWGRPNIKYYIMFAEYLEAHGERVDVLKLIFVHAVMFDLISKSN